MTQGSKSGVDLDERQHIKASCPMTGTLKEFSPCLSLPGLRVAPEAGYGAPACSSANSVIVLRVFWLTPFFPRKVTK